MLLCRLCPRFTVRRLMINVAVVGGLLCLLRAWMISNALGSIAQIHASKEAYYEMLYKKKEISYRKRRNHMISELVKASVVEPGEVDVEGEISRLKRNWREIRAAVAKHPSSCPDEAFEFALAIGPLTELVSYHSRMKQKYEYASRHPWLPVTPDAPEPK